MGSALNLSDFDNTEFVKCGEIVAATKQNEYFFNCVRCNLIFPQLAIFFRHLQWEHRDEEGLPSDQKRVHDANVYTVEELLNYEYGITVGNEGLVAHKANGNLLSDKDDDTGVDSDVELEKEIQELLTSMSTSQSVSECNAEYSEYDSGVESKNNTKQSCNISKEIAERSVGSDNESGFESNNASKDIEVETSVLKKLEINIDESTADELSADGSQVIKKRKIKEKCNDGQETTMKNTIATEEIRNDKYYNQNDNPLNNNNNKEIISIALHDFIHERPREQLDNMLNTDEKKVGYSQLGEDPVTAIETPRLEAANNNDLSVADYSPPHDAQIPITYEYDTPYVIVEMHDDLKVIKSFGKTDMYTTSENGIKETPVEFVDFAASSTEISASFVDDEEPVDLSFDKSTRQSNEQTNEASDTLNDTDYCKTSTMLVEQVDKLLYNQATPTDNPALTIVTNHLHSSNNSEGQKLPPFANFFKNSANKLKATNGFLAQSTPKQKHVIAGSPLRPSAKENIQYNAAYESVHIHSKNLENGISLTKHNKLNCFQHKCNAIKRVADVDEKENETKKIKSENENVAKCIEVKVGDDTKKIEILSVDIIVPHENTQINSNVINIEDKPTTEEISSFKIPVERQELTGSGQHETEIFDTKCHAAADSTSEYAAISFNEIDYTPENTLNQLKLESNADNSLMPNSFNLTATLSFNNNQSSLIDENSILDDSIPSTTSEEEKENFILLRSVGLKIIMDANAEDHLKLKHLEAMREKASTFASIYADFKYLWKVGKGIKSFEQLELDFNKLMLRLNEHYEFELTISQTKRIVNLISLWFMQSYHKWYIEKKPAKGSVCHYLNIFRYLPKTTRRIFYCEECPRYFLVQQKYLSHRKSHMTMAPSCSYCETVFTKRNAQLLHSKVCNTFKCTKCGLKFENAASLEEHLRSKHSLQCGECGRLCANAVELEWHEHQYPIMCGLCNRFLDSAADLQMHRQASFHWDYTCQTCEVFLPTATQMKQHLSLCSGNLVK